jgi:hypothetical protein
MKVYVFQSNYRSLDIAGDPPLKVENWIFQTTDEKAAERARKVSSLWEITDNVEPPDEPKVDEPKVESVGEAVIVEKPKEKKRKPVPRPVTVVHGMRTAKEKDT